MGPEGLGKKPSEMRPSATRRQVQDGWSPVCKGIQHTVLKALFRIMSLTVIPSQFHMLAVLQVYGSHSATEAQPAIKTVKIMNKKMKGRGC